jgi:quinohemoprotein ethanol dehydrogenase
VAWAYAVDTKTGRPIENPAARFKTGTTLVHPGPDGGHNWHPMSYSPQTGLVYIPIQDGALDFTHDPAYARLEGFQNIGVLIGTLPDDPQVRKAIRNGYRGALLAWDPIARKAAWRAERRGAYNGGTLAVAGGVVFQGTIDGHFLAADAKTGKELWSFDNQAATLAGPVSYEVDGEQYVSVPAGYGGVFFLINGLFLPREGSPSNARVYTFKLGGSAPKPVIQFARIPTPKPPVLPVTADQYRRGGLLYDTFCLNCHGIAAITGGVLPDLRKSGRLQDAALWKAAVIDEALADRGMPRFGRYVSAADAELIRAYVARQAFILYDEERATMSSPLTQGTR